VSHSTLQAGKHERAVNLLARHGWWDRLLSLMRTLDQTRDAQPLKAAVAAFKQAGERAAASACC
jgi:hypothetical protein